MAAATIASHRLRFTVKFALFALSIAAVALSTSQTSKLALVAGLSAYLVARFSGQVARLGLSLAWALASLGMVPAVLLLRQFELHNSTALQLSAQLRILIWSRIAQLVPAAPVFGVGADMTYYIRPNMLEAPRAAPDWLGFPIPHPHNVYLQVWYELGLVGAVMLTAFGLLLLRHVGRLAKADRPFACATFAATAAAITSSYNVWQIWFMCLFGFVAAMFALGQSQPDTCGSHATVGEKVSHRHT
jgi:O-antigen ligase